MIIKKRRDTKRFLSETFSQALLQPIKSNISKFLKSLVKRPKSLIQEDLSWYCILWPEAVKLNFPAKVMEGGGKQEESNLYGVTGNT